MHSQTTWETSRTTDPLLSLKRQRIVSLSKLCSGGREAQCSGLQIRKTVGSNPTRYSKLWKIKSIGDENCLENSRALIAPWGFDSLVFRQVFKGEKYGNKRLCRVLEVDAWKRAVVTLSSIVKWYNGRLITGYSTFNSWWRNQINVSLM